MGKSHKKDKEWTELQKLKEENKKLKRKVTRQRKMIEKLENEHALVGVLELVEAQRKEDRDLYDTKKKIDMEKRWGCHTCGKGVLILKIFHRRDGAFYYRRCGHCGNKTKMKKYHENVDGILDEDLEYA